MIKRFAVGVLCALTMAACQPAQDDRTLPTLAVIPSATLTEAPTEIPSQTFTPAPTLTATLTVTPTLPPSETPFPSVTPTDEPTITFTPSKTPPVAPTRNPTTAAIASATARIVEAPTLATLTPVPPGSNAAVRPTSTGTPIVAAGVVISEPQFQEQLNLKLASYADIQQAQVDFVPGGINVQITASGGDAVVTGAVFISFSILPAEEGLNNVLMIQPATPDKFVINGGGTPTEKFVTTVYTEAFPAVGDAFNTILNNRLGAGNHNLENITFSDESMNVFLLVPES